MAVRYERQGYSTICRSDPPDGWLFEDDIPDLEYSGQLIRDAMLALYQTGDLEELENAMVELSLEFQRHGFSDKVEHCQPLKVTRR